MLQRRNSVAAAAKLIGASTLAALWIAGAAGCGQKGALTLPAPSAAASAPSR